MNKISYCKAEIDAKNTKKADENRRFRNIIANSGLEMESGEVRDIQNLYVMSRDSKLIRIGDLATNPEAQNEKYKVTFATDHGHNDEVTGERVVNVEDIIGDAKVWLDKDGMLHARVYFADNDPKADHAWAVSDNASYSIGTEWFPGMEIDEPIGILREISMVDTGNDPRAYTLDHKPESSEAQGSEDDGNGKSISNLTGDSEMAEIKKVDELTPDENRAIKEELNDVVNSFTTTAPEGETEPTRRDNADEEGKETAKNAPAEKKDALHNNFFIVRDKVAKQEVSGSTKTTDYLKSEKAVVAWGKALLDAKGDAKAWRENFRAIAKKDGVDFGENVTIAPEAVINAVKEQLEDEDTLFSHVNKTGLAFEVVAIPTSEDGGVGHARGTTKKEENITGQTRVFTPADLYKLMKLDHAMVRINGGISSSAIVRYVLREMPRKLIETIDKGILIGGIANDDSTTETPTVFTALNPIITDISTSGAIYGVEYTAEAGDNIRQTLSKAANRVKSGTNRTLICTPDYFTDLENATTAGGQLLFPNGINKGEPNINGIRRIITPLWLTDAMLGGYKAIVVDLASYDTVGDATPEQFTDYDIDVNKYVWETVACIGGGLANANAAVGIKAAA